MSNNAKVYDEVYDNLVINWFKTGKYTRTIHVINVTNEGGATKVTDNSWRYLIDKNSEMLGLKTDTVSMRDWLNDICERINAIESNKEAIQVLFTLNQKIGYVKGKNSNYTYPPSLYARLQITVNKLLDARLNSIGGITNEAS
jgi:hypothetical protein